MFWIYYFMLIFCFIGFISAIAETASESDLIGSVFRIFQGVTFATAGIIISGLI